MASACDLVARRGVGRRGGYKERKSAMGFWLILVFVTVAIVALGWQGSRSRRRRPYEDADAADQLGESSGGRGGGMLVVTCAAGAHPGRRSANGVPQHHGLHPLALRRKTSTRRSAPRVTRA